MTVERDIAGITLPFTAGIAASLYFSVHNATPYISFTAIIFGTCLLMHPRHKDFSDNTLWTLILSTMLFCGVLTGFTMQYSSVGVSEAETLLTRLAASACEKLKAAIDRIPFDDAQTNSVIKALITGDKGTLSKETTETFRASGAAHILALSGLHLGVIYGILKFLLSFAGNSRRARIHKSMLTIAMCGFYTLATGAGASLVRAFLFILIGETAALSGRYRSTGTVVFTALLLQAAVTPIEIQTISFQLSYAAMTGIAFIYPLLKRIWPNDGSTFKGLKWIWNSVSMSIACQITTGPIAWFYFGTFPEYFLLTNLITLPLISLIIPFSVVTILLHSSGTCPDLLIQSCEFLISLMTENLRVITTL